MNGVLVTEMGYKVKLTDDRSFDGVNITPEKKEYVLLNKMEKNSLQQEMIQIQLTFWI